MTHADRFETRIDIANDRLIALQRQAAATLGLDTQPVFVATLGELSTALEELHVIAEELNERNAELQATRADLEAERRHYQDLFEFAPDGYLLTSPDGIIQEANQVMAELLGLWPDFLVGKPLILYVAEADRRLFYAALAQLTDRPVTRRWEMSLQPRNGAAYPVAVQAAASRTALGQVSHLRWMIQSIAERQRVEAALRQAQKIDSLGVLAGGVAHDFNNLLVTLLTQTSLALEQLPADSPVRPRLDRVMFAAQAAAQLAQQMLAYSGRGSFDLQPVDLSGLISRYHDLLEAAIPRSIRLVTDLAAGLPPIQADPTQVQQIILNLVLNSADALGARAGTITIETGLEVVGEADQAWVYYTGAPLVPDRYVTLQVSDTGGGIDPALLPKIFDPFFTTKSIGRGLGLAVVLGLVRSHRGGLQIQTQAGVGATFKIALPLAALPEAGTLRAVTPAAPTSTRSVQPPTSNLTGRKVLVIDDQADVIEAVVDVLGIDELDVLTADSGEAGLAMYAQHQADIGLIILDLSMPGLSGQETLRQLHALNPAAIILLSSGFDEQETLRHLDGQTVAGFLQKPYHAAILRAAVRRHLG